MNQPRAIARFAAPLGLTALVLCARLVGAPALSDPVAGTVIAIGNFSFVLNSDGTVARPLEGEGQLIDVCALLG